MYSDLFRNKSLDEQGYILKYFYLIDPESLADSILKSLNGEKQFHLNEETVDTFFQTVLDQLYAYAEQYVKFIPTNSFRDSFFGEGSRSSVTRDSLKDLSAFSYLLKLCLYNYCISEGFFYYFDKEHLPDPNIDFDKKYLADPDNGFSKLSGMNQDFLYSGFFELPRKNSECNSSTDADDPKFQRWHNLLKKFHASCKNNSFASSVINSFPVRKIEEENYLYVPNIYKAPVSIYFTCNSLYQFSRNLASSTPGCLRGSNKSYNDLHNSLINSFPEKHVFSSKTDTYIYQTLNERFFGFSTVSYIAKLLDKLYDCKKDSDEFLTKYKGNAFETLLANLATCPLVYSRHLFFEYALKALNGNNAPETHYLRTSPSAIISKSTPQKSFTEVEQTSKGIILIEQYFHVLNYMVLPMLSALFKTTLAHLKPSILNNAESNYSDPDKLTTYFRMYIDKHYALLTTDYTELDYSAGWRAGSSKTFWKDFVHEDIEKQCSAKQERKPANNFYYDSFIELPSKSFIGPTLHRFFEAPLKTRKNEQKYFPFSYISEEEKGMSRDPSLNEISSFQYQNALKLFNLFS